MAKIQCREAEQAGVVFEALLAGAVNGCSTIIIKDGRPIAALVPIQVFSPQRQKPLRDLAGSGRGLWGLHGARTLRQEWGR